MPSSTSQDARDGAVRREVEPSLLTHRRLLGERVYVHTLVGLSVSVVIIVGALVARYAVGIEELDVTALVILGASIAVYDTLAYFSIRAYRGDSTSEEAQAHSLEIIQTAEKYLSATGKAQPFGAPIDGFGALPEAERRAKAAALAPFIRGLA